ncbi:hypothetical protein L1887_47723 [Cichorium endivia]|nr:hypothetical protein L1887_47723 [Cichorium endivia]
MHSCRARVPIRACGASMAVKPTLVRSRARHENTARGLARGKNDTHASVGEMHREADSEVSEQCGGARARKSFACKPRESRVLMLWRPTVELGERASGRAGGCRRAVVPPHARIGYRGEKARKNAHAAAEDARNAGVTSHKATLSLPSQRVGTAV